jgi:hypothetical protein
MNAINTKISDISFREVWTHMLEYVCLYINKDVYFHPLYDFDNDKAIGYFYKETKEKPITRGKKYKLLPPSDDRTTAIIFFVIDGKFGECLYESKRNRILCILQAGLQENIGDLFEIPQGTKVTKMRSFEESVIGIPSRLFLLARFIEALEGKRSSQRSIIDTFKILNPLFTKSLDLLEAYRKMKR